MHLHFTHSADSKSSENPTYEDREFQGQKPALEGEDLRLYTGSCHCGALTFALKSKPLDEVELKEDNCSICVRVRDQDLPDDPAILFKQVTDS